MPLHHAAAQFAQGLHFLGGFHAFGDHLQPEFFGQGHDGLHDGGVAPVVRQATDEALVDLQATDRQVAQVGERGIAGAEVVDHHLHAQFAQHGHLGDGAARCLDQRVFGQLQAQQFGPDAEFFQHALELRQKTFFVDLVGGDVHRHHQVAVALHVQLLAVLQGAANGPDGQLLHHVALLGRGQELVGQQQALRGVAPADQPFHAHHLQVEAGNHRLVVQFHFSAFDGRRKFAAQLHLRDARRFQVGAVETHVVAAFGFHRVHGGVGALDQRGGVVAVLR